MSKNNCTSEKLVSSKINLFNDPKINFLILWLFKDTISLLDLLRAFDQKVTPKDTNQTSGQNKKSLERIKSYAAFSSQTQAKKPVSRLKSDSVKPTDSNQQNSETSPLQTSLLLNSYGIVHDEWSETSYLGMNILINLISSTDVEVCAQASAKINTILHNRTLQSVEESGYLIASIEKYMNVNSNEGRNGIFIIDLLNFNSCFFSTY